jgi:hypothetical protein
MWTIEIHPNRIQRQRNSTIAFATWGFNVTLFAHLRTNPPPRDYYRPTQPGDRIFCSIHTNQQNPAMAIVQEQTYSLCCQDQANRVPDPKQSSDQAVEPMSGE